MNSTTSATDALEMQNKNMKTRIISGVIIGVLAVAFIYLGGPLFAALMAFFAIWGTWELCSTRNRPINWFEYAIMLSFIMLLNLKPTKDIALIVMLLIFLCTLAVFDERVTFEEICVTFLESNILGFGIRFALLIENLNKWMFGYIVIAALVTDVFALVFGMLFGKHKLNERVSPKKDSRRSYWRLAVRGNHFLCICFIPELFWSWSSFDNYFIYRSSDSIAGR